MSNTNNGSDSNTKVDSSLMDTASKQSEQNQSPKNGDAKPQEKSVPFKPGDFGTNYKKNSKISDRVREFSLTELPVKDQNGELHFPILKLKTTHPSNMEYQSELDKLAKFDVDRQKVVREKIKELKKKGKSTISMGIELQRLRDLEVFPKCIIVGWDDVYNTSGQKVEFSEEACDAFINSIDDWAFDDIRTFCASIENFTEDNDIAEINIQDQEELAKN